MRLFLSCNIPDPISFYLREVTKLLPEAQLKIPRQYDLTLKFFGEVDEPTYEKICHSLQSIHFIPFEASLQTIGVFDETNIRVVWVGVSPNKTFFSLHETIEKAVSPLFSPDNRFFPHITLARVKSLSHKKEFLEALQKIPIKPLSFTIDKLVLFQSKTFQEGAQHSPLFTHHLQ